MSGQPIPEHGNQLGPCAICGKAAYPKFGHFLCSRHGARKYADKADKLHK